MIQDVLKEKIVHFLQLIDSTKADQIQNNIGLCFGLAICHAAMKKIDKLTWWEAVLSAVMSWNGDSKQLNKRFLLPNATKTQTLKELIERVINYVIYYQQGFDKNTDDIDNVSAHQHQMLLPETKNLEILTPDNKILTIQKRQVVVGQFKSHQLMKLLNEKEIENSITILANYAHAITIEYQPPYWIVYDPDNVLDKHKIHKKAKKDLINKIINILGNDISIEVASFANDGQSVMTDLFKMMIEKDPYIILQALPLVAREALEYIAPFLKNIQQNYGTDSVKKMLGKILLTTYQTDAQWNGLYFIARYAPNQLMTILDIVSQTSQGPMQIAAALRKKSCKGITALNMIAQYAPDCINHVKKLLQNNKKNMESKFSHSIFHKKNIVTHHYLLRKKRNNIKNFY